MLECLGELSVCVTGGVWVMEKLFFIHLYPVDNKKN